MDAMLHAGAHGYVLKQNASSQLPAAIRAVAGGAKYVDTTIEQRASRHREPEPPLKPSAAILTQTEEDVLRLVAFSYTHEQIAARLGVGIEDTMRLKASAMQTAGLSSRVQVMTYARARGWLSKNAHAVTVHATGGSGS
jgi:DNA-binding NarL/FixJ family response regulator